MAYCFSLNITAISSKLQKTPPPSISSPIVHLSFTSHFSFSTSSLSLHSHQTLSQLIPDSQMVYGCAIKTQPLRILISGAPASGKGTQCKLIPKKYGLMHIAAGDLLRAKIIAGSENGKRAKEFMDKEKLVPDKIVVMMVKERFNGPHSQEKGWLLDGVVSRTLDPITGKIYHLMYSPRETKEIASRLTQHFDDTEEKVKLCLQIHHQYVEAVLSMYKDVTVKVNGNGSKQDVFAQIDGALTQLLEQKQGKLGTVAA